MEGEIKGCEVNLGAGIEEGSDGVGATRGIGEGKAAVVSVGVRVGTSNEGGDEAGVVGSGGGEEGGEVGKGTGGGGVGERK